MLELIKNYNSHICLLLLAYNTWKNNFNVVISFKYLNFEISVKFL
jgi:hypothetical protein